jgi:predicted PurR-regulated permease PerM
VPPEPTAAVTSRREFTHRVWIVISVILGTCAILSLLWIGADVFLVLFAGILLAIFLRSLSDWVCAHTALGRTGSLVVVVATLLAIMAGVGFLMAGPIAEQVDQLSVRIPEAIRKLKHDLDQYPWGKRLVEAADPAALVPQARSLMGEARGIFSTTLAVITGFFLILFVGLYLGLNAELYLGGFLKLLPVDRRSRAREVLLEVGSTLRRWIIGQLLSMTMIGLLTGFGLYFLKVPLPVVLGILTGVLDFIPLVGPFIAGSATVLLAFLNSPILALYVLLLFIGLQFVESHLLIPIIQRQATRVPPVLTLLAMVLFGSLFGFLGVLLATPLLAALLVLVKRLYIEDVLEDKEKG